MDAPRIGGTRTALRRFFGGIALPALKPKPAPVERLPVPSVLRVPLRQHAGAECEPCVAAGERVARFQRIGDVPEGALGAPVHAPAAGVVIALERRTVALPGLPEALHVVIDVDRDARGGAASDENSVDRDDAASHAVEHRLRPLDPETSPIDALRERIHEAGVVGLGGAGFPSADKLAVARRLLILNGAECEPVVACDEALLRERAAEVIDGGRLLARISGATRIVLAMEQRMASALPAVRAAIERVAPASAPDETTSTPGASPRAWSAPPIELALLPNRYPAGGERQLIQAITGEEVPDDGLPRDLGVLVHNVGTAFAALRAVRDGEPLVSRFVTVGGTGVDGAATFEVLIGTPARVLGEAVGGWRADATTLRAGGPMMGVALPHDDIAIGKTTIALTAWRGATASHGRQRATAATATALPCIRCGDCATACPSRLQPQLIHARLVANDAPGAAMLGLRACIECGACDAACPSAIPLVAGFIAAREAMRAAAHQRQQADAARGRFEARIERLQRDADEAVQAQAKRTTRLSGAAAAALAKARAKRAANGNDADDAARDNGASARGADREP